MVVMLSHKGSVICFALASLLLALCQELHSQPKATDLLAHFTMVGTDLGATPRAPSVSLATRWR